MKNEKVISNFIEALKKSSRVYARVGILENNSRQETSLTNAEIGAQHEFGTSKIPQRSFLRMPIANYLEEKLQEAHVFNKRTVDEIVSEKSMKPLLKRIGSIAHEVVMEAFDTGGYGNWRALSPVTIALKGNDTILIETFQLKDSIGWDVVNA